MTIYRVSPEQLAADEAYLYGARPAHKPPSMWLIGSGLVAAFALLCSQVAAYGPDRIVITDSHHTQTYSCLITTLHEPAVGSQEPPIADAENCTATTRTRSTPTPHAITGPWLASLEGINAQPINYVGCALIDLNVSPNGARVHLRCEP